MFNYSEIDKYATVEVLAVLIPWIAANQPMMNHYMISSVRREKGTDNYLVLFTDAGSGTRRKYKVTGGTVEFDKDYDGGFWMS